MPVGGLVDELLFEVAEQLIAVPDRVEVVAEHTLLRGGLTTASLSTLGVVLCAALGLPLVGGLAASAMGLGGAATAIPMGITMFACATAALVILLIRRR